MVGLGKMNMTAACIYCNRLRLSFLFTSMLPVAGYVSLSPIFEVIPRTTSVKVGTWSFCRANTLLQFTE